MIEALLFGFARMFRHEPTFQKYSATGAEISAALQGKRVAIIGNARALGETSFGARIDAADIVIRINRAPMQNATSHGTKTNWVALATSLSQEDYSRIAPQRILWMSHKRKRLPHWIAQKAGFYLHPLTDWQRLNKHLGHPPSTGAMIIDLIQRSDAQSIDLYGFDFFQSKSLSGSRKASQVPHDFSAEKDYVLGLKDTDKRFTINN